MTHQTTDILWQLEPKPLEPSRVTTIWGVGLHAHHFLCKTNLQTQNNLQQVIIILQINPSLG